MASISKNYMFLVDVCVWKTGKEIKTATTSKLCWCINCLWMHRVMNHGCMQHVMMHWCNETQIVCSASRPVPGLVLFYCNAVNSLNWKKFRDLESRDQVFFLFKFSCTETQPDSTLFVRTLKTCYFMLFDFIIGLSTDFPRQKSTKPSSTNHGSYGVKHGARSVQ